MSTPRAFFFPREGRFLQALLWVITALFFTIMIVTWVSAERARPVLLDLETGKPVKKRPALAVTGPELLRR